MVFLMNCQAFRKFLDESESAARVQDLPLPLQEHLHGCFLCQREWQLHQRLFDALAHEPDYPPAQAFVAAVMARLPAAPFKKRRFDFDTLLMLALVPAAFTALWYLSRAFWPRLISRETLETFYGLIEKIGRDFLRITFGKMQEMMIHTFGQDMVAQVGQVIFISAVTFLVAKSAVLLESRIRRRLNG